MSVFLFEDITIDIYENYQKMSLRNRCHVASPQGMLKLSVPLSHGRNQRKIVKDVEIHNDGKWQSLQWKTMQSCYRKSPYFEYFEKETKEFYDTEYEHLQDLNSASLELLMTMLNHDKEIKVTSEYQNIKGGFNQLLITSTNKGIPPIQFPTYQQVFGDRHEFIQNLSVIDLLFCVGPKEAYEYLKNVNSSLKKNLIFD